MSAAESRPRSFDKLQAHYDALGQNHLFRDRDALADSDRQRFDARLEALADELPGLIEARRRSVASLTAEVASVLEPPQVISHPHAGGDAAAFERAAAIGREWLEAGRMAVFVVAGGQGTRLGFDGPKGLYPVGPVSSRSLFEIQAQKIRGLSRRCGRRLPWYVMTSDATDAPTRAFFERNDYLGLDPADVFFFLQQKVPAFDFQGRLVLEAPGRLFESPNGHGGSLTALAESGALDDMERRGIDTLFYYQVDNPLVRICDPAFIGFHAEADAQMSCKVVRKRDPMEKVGVLALRGGALAVVEYTELRDEHRSARDSSQQLVYWAGNAAIHLFSVEFVREAAEQADRWLAYHASAKKIPFVDASGRVVAPDEPNAHKLERFVFDVLPHAERACIVEALVADEFSPIKNAQGSESPATARRDLDACYRRWLTAAGTQFPPDDTWIEIDHSRIDDASEACEAGFRNAAEAGAVIRVANGSER